MPSCFMRLVVAVLTCWLAISSAGATEFRIESSLFVDGDDKPASENVTLFRGGIVYDYLSAPAETTIFDPGRGLFILLDPVRRIRTEISAAEIDRRVGKLKGIAAEDDDAFLRFQAEPTFEVQTSGPGNEVTFKSPWMTYVVSVEPAQTVEGARQYIEFCDWCARLNVLSRPALLPFARLQVNAELNRRQVLPLRVQLTVSNPSSFPTQRQKIALRTEHQVTWRLSKPDVRRIEQTGEDLVNFKPIPFAEYRQPASDKTARK
jgi:hypothetical protein